MMKAMFSGASAVRAHQSKMDVIANNVSNVNTDEFKSSTLTFQDTLVKTLRQARAPGEDTGGANPIQVGTGVAVGSIRRTTTPGAKRIEFDTIEISSNTQLAKEFPKTIIAQRGLQANARVIPVVDLMLEEVINIKK